MTAMDTRTARALATYHHMGLTVRDVEASESWYGRVLGFVRAFVEPHPEGGGHAGVMTRPGTHIFLGLDYRPNADKQLFDMCRTGLDHLAIAVPAREDVDAWVTHLDALGVEHGPLTTGEAPAPFALVVFPDPDGIPIELIWFGA